MGNFTLMGMDNNRARAPLFVPEALSGDGGGGPPTSSNYLSVQRRGLPATQGAMMPPGGYGQAHHGHPDTRRAMMPPGGYGQAHRDTPDIRGTLMPPGGYGNRSATGWIAHSDTPDTRGALMPPGGYGNRRYRAPPRDRLMSQPPGSEHAGKPKMSSGPTAMFYFSTTIKFT